MINKHLMVVGLVASAALLAGCNDDAKKGGDDSKLSTLEQKVSYIIGQNMAKSLQQNGVTLETDAFLLAVEDVKAAEKNQKKINELQMKAPEALTKEETAELEKLRAAVAPRLSEEETKKSMEEMQAKVSAQKEEETKKLSETNAAEGKKFLDENKAKEGVQVTASGLQYKVITEGTGTKPKATDTVSVHYVGKLVNGTEFDSSRKHGDQPVTFPVNGVIPGWTEALQLMPQGSKWELYIPSDLAYGPGGSGPIPAAATLIFEVELLDVKAADAEPEEKPAAKAKK